MAFQFVQFKHMNSPFKQIKIQCISKISFKILNSHPCRSLRRFSNISHKCQLIRFHLNLNRLIRFRYLQRSLFLQNQRRSRWYIPK